MKILSYDLETKFDTTTDEYVFMHKSMEKSEIVFIKGEEDIALELARQVCECPHLEIPNVMLKNIMKDDSDFKYKCRDIIMTGNMNISREFLKETQEKMGQENNRFIFIGKSRIPRGVEGIAVVEIRPKERCNISREEGIEIEMIGPDCTGLTRICLRYKRGDRI